jgi:hypothetical protein
MERIVRTGCGITHAYRDQIHLKPTIYGGKGESSGENRGG